MQSNAGSRHVSIERGAEILCLADPVQRSWMMAQTTTLVVRFVQPEDKAHDTLSLPNQDTAP
jgi:hypothetical protein